MEPKNEALEEEIPFWEQWFSSFMSVFGGVAMDKKKATKSSNTVPPRPPQKYSNKTILELQLSFLGPKKPAGKLTWPMKKLDLLTRCIYIFPIKKQICHIFSYKIFQAFMLQSHWICVTISPNQKLPQRMGQLHRAAGRNSRPGRPHRQRAVACPSKIRRAHRKSLARHCAKSCWCRWVHGARALPWPEDSAKDFIVGW